MNRSTVLLKSCLVLFHSFQSWDDVIIRKLLVLLNGKICLAMRCGRCCHLCLVRKSSCLRCLGAHGSNIDFMCSNEIGDIRLERGCSI